MEDEEHEEHEPDVEAVAAARTLRGRRRYREVMVSEAPPPMTPYLDKGVVDSVSVSCGTIAPLADTVLHVRRLMVVDRSSTSP